MNQLDQLYIQEVKNRIALNKTEEVIGDLLEFGKIAVRESDYNSLILVASRYYSLQDEQMGGLISPQEADVKKVRINNSLIYWIDQTYKNAQRKPLFSNTFSSRINADLPKEEGFEKLIGSNNLAKFKWLRMGMEAGAPVCMIELGARRGTGFLLKNGYLLTNNHVLKTADEAANAVAVFNFEESISGGAIQQYKYKTEPVSYLGSANLDYALVKLAHISFEGPQKPLSDWGNLTLSTAKPALEDYVTIIQHPLGQDKQLAFDRVSAVQPNYLLYKTDTDKGSSGSPVFNMDWKVVALHHWGMETKDENRGVLVEAILGSLPGDVRALIEG
ncbi:MAG: trypsin-like peptidase domain-containing protein [Bacteroidota bacterium]|uniref:trypsin-like peptidase domain-containing protein n=1 Tax=Runella sp. TaxID=1960881 RepID=UPI003016C345